MKPHRIILLLGLALLALPALAMAGRVPIGVTPPSPHARPPVLGKALVIQPTWTSYLNTRAGCLAAFSLGTNLTEGSLVGIVVTGPMGTDVYEVRVQPLDPFMTPTPVTGIRLWRSTVYEVFARYPNNELGVQSNHILTTCADGLPPPARR